MGKISEGLQRAVEAQFTRKPPVSTRARARFLVKQYGGTRAVAALLGVSQRTVERYLTGARRTPPPAIAAKLDAEVRRRWQPLVRRRATRRAATTTGITIETRATFGYDAPAGTTDEGRLRRITQHLPPSYAARLLQADDAGASEAELARIVAEGFGEHYFRDGGRRAHGLGVRLTGIDYLDAGL
jgi:transcriptional regulator with XRE-family HTH domain